MWCIIVFIFVFFILFHFNVINTFFLPLLFETFLRTINAKQNIYNNFKYIGIYTYIIVLTK